MFLKEFPSTEEKYIKIMNNDTLNVEGMPLVLTPRGLSAERAWYLHKHIREHVSDDSKDITCPNPTVSKPKSLDILKYERNKSDD